MAFEEVIIGLIVVLLILIGVVIYRILRMGNLAGEGRFSDLDKSLTMLSQQVDDMRGRIDDLLPVVNEIQKKAITLEERTSSLPKTHELTLQVEDRTRILSDTTRQLGTIETKMNRVETIDAKLDDLRGIFSSDRKRGEMGEAAVTAILGGLPEDLWDSQVTIGDGRADFVTFMPNGSWLPIDSKTGGSELVKEILELMAHLSEPAEGEDIGQIQKNVTGRVSMLGKKIVDQAWDISKYSKQESRCLPVAVEAIPDSVFDVLPPETRRECSEINVEVIPYSLLIPFIGSLRRLNLYRKSDIERVLEALVKVRGHLSDLDSIVTDRIERSQKLLANAIPDIRDRIAKIQADLASAEAKPDSEDTAGAKEG